VLFAFGASRRRFVPVLLVFDAHQNAFNFRNGCLEACNFPMCSVGPNRSSEFALSDVYLPGQQWFKLLAKCGFLPLDAANVIVENRHRNGHTDTLSQHHVNFRELYKPGVVVVCSESDIEIRFVSIAAESLSVSADQCPFLPMAT